MYKKVDQPLFDLSEGTDRRLYSFSIDINAFFGIDCSGNMIEPKGAN